MTALGSPTHRILARDGYRECFACGTAIEIESDAATDALLAQVDCKPGGWTHPAYISGGFIETCLAHETYECAHVADPGVIFESDDEDAATSHCTLCGFPIEWDPRNSWTHASLREVPA